MFINRPKSNTMVQVFWVKLTTGTRGGTHFHHGIAALTLGGMARLVAGDGNACDRTARTVGIRQIQVVVLRVVMVR